ncbi:N-acetylglucosaminyl deacetylase, LmbE family [Loktanella fryxellensis]|uniref:N-acetylglucosaminyl deacetylase, LmbE family n=1 Tax=Loktanella fryxellensis TaxID=245187 RepID=A0A1H8IU79_9RHOB|nr:PIG-L family deacetylase [Loktanella fryxellensis]SEN71537.1 N-acetylglucosaminyl deacetylase, LmbE family [Loktanella fryxellensis]
MTPDQTRLARREATPALMRLSRALSRLDGVQTVMNTGAHPDDEHSGLLAWLRFGLGMRVVVACSTRGEGGQNALGPERGGLLGLIRTREMEEAARVLDCDVAWLGFGPADPMHDFGFSKDGDDTFARWGAARVTERLARAYRTYRPDVVLPTFLDVPGQHGHHRAMTRAAAEAIALAADPTKLTDHPDGPWTVTHHYLPAWSGGGGTYDDALPPPPATLRITAGPQDAATGVAYAEIGQWSRARHASQGMGHWSDSPQTTWDLHRVGGAAEDRLAQSLPRSLADLAALAGPAGDALLTAADGVAQARMACPDRGVVQDSLAQADEALAKAISTATPEFLTAHGHRLTRKRREIAHALAEVAGLFPIVAAYPAALVPGGTARLRVTQPTPTTATKVTVTPVLPQGVTGGTVAPAGAVVDLDLQVAVDAPFTPAFTAGFDPLGGNGSGWLDVAATVAGRRISISVDPEVPLCVVPAQDFAAHPSQFIRCTGDTANLTANVTGTPEIEVPAGWTLTQDGTRLTIAPPAGTAQGLVTLPVYIDGRAAQATATAHYPHIGSLRHATPATLQILTLDLALPQGARIAYVGSGDSVGRWLQRLGLDVTLLDDIAPQEDFSAFTTVLVGVVAYGNRPDLAAATARLHAFVERGGHLVTLYQRPDQGWDADATPPRPMTVGTPSLRWRVTDAAAQVTLLIPDHPLLTGPNVITAADFEGWDKERGLYFAARWDEAYVPLLALSDPGEAPLQGALVSGRIGRGRHTHTGLVLHHQMDRLVPGAFRLMCNLIQPA